jgi:DNA-binding LytR/AlgR family response regulator
MVACAVRDANMPALHVPMWLDTGLRLDLAPAFSERPTAICAVLGNQVCVIPVADALYFETKSKCVNMMSANGESLIRTSIKKLLPQIDSSRF